MQEVGQELDAVDDAQDDDLAVARVDHCSVAREGVGRDLEPAHIP